LSGILNRLAVEEVHGRTDVDVSGVTHDSRRVGPNYLFVAVEGLRRRGVEFIEDAVKRGATAVVTTATYREGFPAGARGALTWVTVRDTRLALSKAAASFCGNPTERLRVVGVTGTSGKTTCIYLIHSVLEAGGIPSGLMGTIEVRSSAGRRKSVLTTPEATDIHAAAREMLDHGTGALVMEVSSHSLMLHRVDDVDFDIGVFTNLGHDHLDFHGSLEEYASSKSILFSRLLKAGPGRGAVVNAADEWTDRVTGGYGGDIIRFSPEDRSGIDIAPTSFRADLEGIHGRLRTPWGAVEVSSPLLGRHNMLNIMAAAGAGMLSGMTLEKVGEGIARLEKVPGRMEKVPGAGGRIAVVDYSHTPDSLKAAIDSLSHLGRRRIITVFGAGGDREKEKRPLMGKAVCEKSAACIVTSDNPRTEDPLAIIDMIVAGLEEGGFRRSRGGLEQGTYTVIPDRRDAIRFAVSRSLPDDVILVAGKGHEDYQIFKDRVIHFDDMEAVGEALEESGLGAS
jgi:UDP-N-acetylmuramoyl-L-alanyl-D-glutamate--2,6-diaminopimelate ligase